MPKAFKCHFDWQRIKETQWQVSLHKQMVARPLFWTPKRWRNLTVGKNGFSCQTQTSPICKYSFYVTALLTLHSCNTMNLEGSRTYRAHLGRKGPPREISHSSLENHEKKDPRTAPTLLTLAHSHSTTSGQGAALYKGSATSGGFEKECYPGEGLGWAGKDSPAGYLLNLAQHPHPVQHKWQHSLAPSASSYPVLPSAAGFAVAYTPNGVKQPIACNTSTFLISYKTSEKKMMQKSCHEIGLFHETSRHPIIDN